MVFGVPTQRERGIVMSPQRFVPKLIQQYYHEKDHQLTENVKVNECLSFTTMHVHTLLTSTVICEIFHVKKCVYIFMLKVFWYYTKV